MKKTDANGTRLIYLFFIIIRGRRRLRRRAMPVMYGRPSFHSCFFSSFHLSPKLTLFEQNRQSHPQ